MPTALTKRKAQGTRELRLEVHPQPTQPAAATSIAIYGVTIALSAFLLFQIQLVMGKFILPRFGGGPSVWSTSLLIFQILLLLGYGYAALLCAKFSSRMQG